MNLLKTHFIAFITEILIKINKSLLKILIIEKKVKIKQ